MDCSGFTMNSSAGATTMVGCFQLLSRLLAGETAPLERLLTELANHLHLAELGVRWPIPGNARVFAAVGQPTEETSLWGAEVVGRLAGAKSSEEAFTHPLDGNRLLVPLLVDGRRNGALWAAGQGRIGDEEIPALILAAQCLVRNQAFKEKTGPVMDQARIVQRLQDAAVVGGKIAHDFDNIFTGVVGFAEMVQGLLEPGTLAHQYVAEIASAGNRGIAFTQQLHVLSRSGAVRPMPTAVSSVLLREEARLRKIKGLTARLQFAAPNDLPPVAVDGGALQQVLGNLLDNAVEASPAGGAVRVSAALIELSEMEAGEYLGAAAAGPFVEVRISDDGPGVRDDHRAKLFVEPFFTTKVRHRGLGLPVALRILSSHRGGVRYEAGPNRGATFHVALPLAAARVPDPGNAPLDNSRIPGGNAT
jgi:signal transduction histidine kinase